MARKPFPAVLHCFTGGPELARRGARPRALHLVLGHPDVQEVGRPARDRSHRAARPAAGGDRRALPGARQIPRQAQRAGLRGGDGARAGQASRASRRRSSPAPRPRISSGSTPRRRGRRWPHEHALHDPGHAAPRAACRASATSGATAIRPIRRTAGGVARCWWSGSASRGARPCWSTRRPTCASSCWTRASSTSTPCSSRTTTPTTRTASTICGACSSSRNAGASPSTPMPKRARASRAASTTASRSSRARSIPAILEAHDIRPPEPMRIDGAGGAIEAVPILQEHGELAFARLPLRQRRLFARHQRHPGGLVAAAAGARCVDRRRAAAGAAPQPLQRQAGAAMDRAPRASSGRSSPT